MPAQKSIATCFTLFILLFTFQYAHTCSTYKVTANGKTLVYGAVFAAHEASR